VPMGIPGGNTFRGNLGHQGEQIAASFLESQGYLLIDRNWRCARGEIDIVACRGDDLVFVEVKTRSSLSHGHPLEAITLSKLARLRSLAAAWRQAHPEARGVPRIDALAVLIPQGAPYEIEHVQGVFA
jgi:putative endonuclease